MKWRRHNGVQEMLVVEAEIVGRVKGSFLFFNCPIEGHFCCDNLPFVNLGCCKVCRRSNTHEQHKRANSNNDPNQVLQGTNITKLVNDDVTTGKIEVAPLKGCHVACLPTRHVRYRGEVWTVAEVLSIMHVRRATVLRRSHRYVTSFTAVISVHVRI